MFKQTIVPFEMNSEFGVYDMDPLKDKTAEDTNCAELGLAMVHVASMKATKIVATTLGLPMFSPPLDVLFCDFCWSQTIRAIWL